MAYQTLSDVTGLNKLITIRDKRTGVLILVGRVHDEVSVSDGEQKYFIQRVPLSEGTICEDDPTREVYRIGYYTQRTDGPFCLGSQFTPILTPAELLMLFSQAMEKGWLKLTDIQ